MGRMGTIGLPVDKGIASTIFISAPSTAGAVTLELYAGSVNGNVIVPGGVVPVQVIVVVVSTAGEFTVRSNFAALVVPVTVTWADALVVPTQPRDANSAVSLSVRVPLPVTCVDGGGEGGGGGISTKGREGSPVAFKASVPSQTAVNL